MNNESKWTRRGSAACLLLAAASCGDSGTEPAPSGGTAGQAGVTNTTAGTSAVGAAGKTAAGSTAAGAGSSGSAIAGSLATGGAGSTATPTNTAGAAAGSGAGAGAGSGAGAGGANAGATAGGGGTGGASGGGLGGPLTYTGAFTMGMSIGSKYTCPMPAGASGMGENKSPLLSWKGGPADTKSFAVVLYDTRYNMLHWTLWDIPPTVNELPEGLPSGYALTNPAGAHQQSNMGPMHAYYGPCSGGSFAGTYEYRLYALNVATLSLTESSTGPEAQKAIEAAMLGMTVWSGKPM